MFRHLNPSMHRSHIRFLHKLMLSAAIVLPLSLFAFGDDTGNSKGLDDLSDDRLLNELAGRGLRSLMDRAFDDNNTPDNKRTAIFGRLALIEIRNRGNDMPVVQKRQKIVEFTKALPTLLVTMNDAEALIGDSNILIENGIESEQKLLEYFGHNDSVEARLAPIASAVDKMLDKSAEICKTAMTKAEQNWPAGEKAWDRANERKTISEYTRAVIAYTRAISADKSDQTRKETIAKGIEYLSQYDTDENPDRADVKFFIGKLHLADASKESLVAARNEFDFVQKSGKQDNIAQQYESRMMRVLVEVAAEDAKAADEQLKTFEDYVKKNLSKDPSASTGVEAVRFQIYDLQARKSADADHDKLNGLALDTLDKLVARDPSLRPIILELMSSRVPPGTPVTQLNSLLLQAEINKAEQEYLKGASGNKSVVSRGVEAIREYLSREGKPGIDPKLIPTCRYILGFFTEYVQNSPEQQLAAAEAYLAYLKMHGKEDPQNSGVRALQNGLSLASRLRKLPDSPQRISVIYDDLLTIGASDPYKLPDCQFQLGRRLLQTAKFDEAAKWLRVIPATHASYADAQYSLLIASSQAMKALPPEQRQEKLAEIRTLTDSVKKNTEDQLAAAKDESQKISLRFRLAQTRLNGADVALNIEKDPKRAVELTDEFEKVIEGLPNTESLLTQVIVIRLNGRMQTGDINGATQAVVELIKRDPQLGGQRVFDMLEKVDRDVASAEAGKRVDEVRQLEQNRAVLTPFLVDWAEKQTDERIKKSVYRYKVFDADTQRRAAELNEDKDKSKTLLEASVKRFAELENADNLKKYIESLPEDKRKNVKYDPQVTLGAARSLFALGDWQNASNKFAILWRDRAVGPAEITKTGPAGEALTEENPLYWEVMVRWCRANINLNKNLDDVKSVLTNMVITWGDNAGGARWGEEFNSLRLEMVPDVKASVTTEPTPTSQPAGQ